MGGKQRPERPASSGRTHPCRGATQWSSRSASAGLRSSAAGLAGSAARSRATGRGHERRRRRISGVPRSRRRSRRQPKKRAPRAARADPRRRAGLRDPAANVDGSETGRAAPCASRSARGALNRVPRPVRRSGAKTEERVVSPAPQLRRPLSAQPIAASERQRHANRLRIWSRTTARERPHACATRAFPRMTGPLAHTG